MYFLPLHFRYKKNEWQNNNFLNRSLNGLDNTMRKTPMLTGVGTQILCTEEIYVNVHFEGENISFDEIVNSFRTKNLDPNSL